jgi:hypothetical protein
MRRNVRKKKKEHKRSEYTKRYQKASEAGSKTRKAKKRE